MQSRLLSHYFTRLLPALFLTANSLSAQTPPGIWENHGPERVVSITSILALPSDPSAVFVGTHGGLLKSRNGGITWEQADAKLQDFQVSQLLHVNGTIFAVPGGGPFYYSDNGVDWFLTELPQIIIEKGDVIFPIVSKDSILFAGTDKDGILRSYDNCASWSMSNPPMADKVINALLVVNDTLYAGTGRRFLSAPAFGVYFSTDNGDSWQQANAPMNTTEVRTMLSLDRIVIAGTDGAGVFYSSDGLNWNQAKPPMDTTNVSILFAAGDSVIYAGTENAGIWMSSDEGKNWTPAGAPLNDQIVSSIASFFGELIVGTIENGVFRSNDGVNWVQAIPPMDRQSTTALSSAGDVLYAGTESEGVFRTRDGVNWFPTAKLPELVYLSNMLLDDKFIIAAGGTGVFRSVDGGLNWVRADPPLDGGTFVGGIIYFKDLLYLTTKSGGVYTSGDGLNWRQASPPLDSLPTWTVLPVGDMVYAGTLGGGVWRTIDGLNWIQADAPMNDTDVIAFLSMDDALYASAHRKGLFRSDDGGSNWIQVDSPLNDKIVYPLVSDGQTLYAIAFDDGVILHDFIRSNSGAELFKSSDGLNWTSVEIPQPSNRVASLLMLDSTLYLGYRNFGTFQSSDGGSTWEQLSAPWNLDPIQRILSVDGVLFSGANFLRAGAGLGGIYRSTDGGMNWNPINNGLSLTLSERMGGLHYFPLLNRIYVANAGISFLEVDFNPPTAQSLHLTNEAAYTADQTISVIVKADGADSLSFSEDSTFANANWEAYSQVSNYTLSDEDGLKTIYAKFKDYSWNQSEVIRTQLTLDTTPPTFLPHTPPDPVVPGRAVIITQQVNEANPDKVELFFRRPGEPFSPNRRIVFDADSAEIDSVFTTNRGLDYRIVATDLARQIDTLRNGDLTFFSLPALLESGDLGSSPGLPGGIGGESFRMVSTPMRFNGTQDVTSVFGDLGKNGTDSDYLFWNYVQNGNWEQGPQNTIETGRAYFILLRRGRTLTNNISGSSAATSSGIIGEFPGWQLSENDWTLVGNPYNTRIDLRQLRLLNQDHLLGQSNGVVQVWLYDGREENSGWTNEVLFLEPWGGIAIYSAEEDKLIFANRRDPYRPPEGPRKTVNGNALASIDPSAGEWLVQVSHLLDKVNYFGMRNGARVGTDSFDLMEPPVLPGSISLSFERSGSRLPLASDIRPVAQEGSKWRLQVTANGGAEVSLNFEGLENLPVGFQLFILDESTRILRDLKMQSQISIRIPRDQKSKKFMIVAGKSEFVFQQSAGLSAIPLGFTLHQNYPNPFNPTTVIRYALPVAGKVTLKIYDLLGQEVMTLEDGERGAGFYEAVADMNGMSSGIYVYQIVVDGERRYRSTGKMLMIK